MRGSVFQKTKGGTWNIKYDLPRGPNGKRHQHEEAIPGTKANAEKVLLERLAVINNGKYVQPNKLDVAACVRMYIDYKIKEGLWEELTAEKYEGMANGHLIPDLGHILVSELTTTAIQRYYDDLVMNGSSQGNGKKSGRGLSGKTIRNLNGLLRPALQHAVDRGYIAQNPASSVKLPKYKRQEIFVLTDEQADLVFRAVRDTRFELPALIGFTTGVRREELLALTEDNVNLESGTITIDHAVVKTKKGLIVKLPKTDAGNRTITIPRVTADALRDRIVAQRMDRLSAGAGFNDGKYLFTKENGEMWNPDQFSRDFGEFANKMGLPRFTFKTLRHTHATRLLDNGISLKAVQERLGHTDPALALRTYIHSQPKMELFAASTMGRMVQEIECRNSPSSTVESKNGNGHFVDSREIELFIRLRCGAASRESLMAEYQVSLSKIEELERMNVEEVLEVLRQIGDKTTVAPATEVIDLTLVPIPE